MRESALRDSEHGPGGREAEVPSCSATPASRSSTRWRRLLRPRADSLTRGPSPLPAATAVVAGHPVPGVLEIHLEGGARRNVLGRSTISRIEMLVASPPPDTRVILITADPPDFCAGYDLFEAYATGAEPLIAHEANFRQLRISSLPVVAALRGRVIGGGIELALAADVRLGAPDTLMSIPAAKLGLVYSASGLRLLVDELGESAVRAMVLGGRRLTAADALAVGGLSEIVPLGELRERSLALASTIASWPASATANNRRVLDVISGRVDGDTAALRKTGFGEGGPLAARIEQFVAEHGQPRLPASSRSTSVLAPGLEMIRRFRHRAGRHQEPRHT